jgi:hypothetical protein
VRTRRFVIVVGLSALAACSANTGGQQVPNAPDLMSTKRERSAANNCPASYFGCVVVAYNAAASIKVCFYRDGDCRRSGKPLEWSAVILGFNGNPDLRVSFQPNPGDPSVDRISESRPLKSSHGKVEFLEYAKAKLKGRLYGSLPIGIIVR